MNFPKNVSADQCGSNFHPGWATTQKASWSLPLIRSQYHISALHENLHSNVGGLSSLIRLEYALQNRYCFLWISSSLPRVLDGISPGEFRTRVLGHQASAIAVVFPVTELSTCLQGTEWQFTQNSIESEQIYMHRNVKFTACQCLVIISLVSWPVGPRLHRAGGVSLNSGSKAFKWTVRQELFSVALKLGMGPVAGAEDKDKDLVAWWMFPAPE